MTSASVAGRCIVEGSLYGERDPRIQPNSEALRGHHSVLAESRAVSPESSPKTSTGLHFKSGLADDVVARAPWERAKQSLRVSCLTRWPTETVLGWVEAGRRRSPVPRMRRRRQD